MRPTPKPLVTVLMGVYNCNKYVPEAISSILNQTYKNIEFLIIDDCSTDGTLEIIKFFATTDSRIRIIENKQNMGLGYSLHLGMNEAKGKYIARMDADDVSMPHRISTQVDFLEKHPNVFCVGSSTKRIGDLNRLSSWFNVIHTRCKHAEIKAWLILGTPMFHSSVMFNKALMKQNDLNYDATYRRAQDYELWTRMVFIGDMANIKKPLLCYRYHKGMASVVASSEQRAKALVLQNRMLKHLLKREPTSEELQLHKTFVFGTGLNNEQLKAVDNWLFLILDKAKSSNCFSYNAVKEMIATRRAVMIRESIHSRIKRLNRYMSKLLLSTIRLRVLLMLLK